jgi:hypothetical protein
VVVEQKALFITVGSPQPHDSSVENVFPQWLKATVMVMVLDGLKSRPLQSKTPSVQ